MNDRELMQQALDALERWDARGRLRIMEALRARLAQPEPEPLWIRNEDGKLELHAPPQRKWQGLTDEEINSMWEEWKDALCLDHKTWGRAIEAKLKEKNHG